MREIEFRGWDKKRNEMIFYPNWYTLYDSHVLVFDDDPNPSYIDESDVERDIELMEFTGLVDKNGTRIFENDIATDGRSTVQIAWMDTHGWGCKVLSPNGLSQGLTFPLWQWDNCGKNGSRQLTVIGNIHDKEVIGNIFDNPELPEVMA